MVKKYKFRRNQTVTFYSVEDGLIMTGKIVGFGTHNAKYKKGGEPYIKVSAYNVEEPDGTVWSCDEEDLTAVQED